MKDDLVRTEAAPGDETPTEVWERKDDSRPAVGIITQKRIPLFFITGLRRRGRLPRVDMWEMTLLASDTPHSFFCFCPWSSLKVAIHELYWHARDIGTSLAENWALLLGKTLFAPRPRSGITSIVRSEKGYQTWPAIPPQMPTR